MRVGIILLALVAGLMGGLLGVTLIKPHPQGVEAVHESAYQRVLRTKTLRCGYALYDVLLQKDPNSGKLSGIFYDLTEAMAKELGLKVEWTMEVGYGDIEEALRSDKFDMFCTGAMTNPKRAKHSLQTIPLYYSGLVAWVRAGDHRFDGDLAKLNNVDVRLATRDGDASDEIAGRLFPQAKKVASAQLADFTQMLMDVKAGKADATFFDPEFGARFLEANPGSVRAIFADRPLFLAPVTMMLPMAEPQLKNMVDATLRNMVLRGDMQALMRKYVGTTKYFWFDAMPEKGE
ncbi:MAG: transporter substrate-binding domain-containing protein [Proteobacteria bacterium]|nr:transporter substrate-binding domain-containing protein [Pseudomonadota bacterium]